MNEAIISLKPTFANLILSGEKTIELRRTRINVLPNTRLWLYCTLPIGSFLATAIISAVHYDTPANIWQLYSEKVGISKKEFNSYIKGCKYVTAIEINNINPLKRNITLTQLKKHIPFHPPQVMTNLTHSCPVLNILKTALPQYHKNNI